MGLPFYGMRCWRSVGINVLLLGIGSSSVTLVARGQYVGASSTGPSDVHIGVVERSEPVRISARNVSAMVAGKSCSVVISQNVATHLLVILQESPENIAPFNEAMESLDPVFGRGWLVSVVRPDGYETPYLGSKAALGNAMGDGTRAVFDYQASFRELASFSGRRVMLVEQPKSTTNPAMLAAARGLIPEIYRVDGGFPTRSMNTSAGLVGANSDAAALPDPTVELVGNCPPESEAEFCVPEAPGQTGFPTKGRTANGVMHEVNFTSAVKDALRDADHYYDLDLKVPASGLDASLKLTYSHLPRSTVVFSERPYLVAAAANDSAKREPLEGGFQVEVLRPSR